MDRRFDLLFSVVVVALGIFVLVETQTIPDGVFVDPVGPRAFFNGIGAFFVVGGSSIVFRRGVQWFRGRDDAHEVPAEGSKDEPGIPSSGARSYGIVAICLGYVALWEPLGYLFSTPVFLVAALGAMGERRWLRLTVIAIAFTAVSYFVFAQFLNVRLPVGPLRPWFRDLGWVNI